MMQWLSIWLSGFTGPGFLSGFVTRSRFAVISFMYGDVIALGEDSWPALFNQVHLAFDAGEVGPSGIDPIEVHARPMFAKIVRDLADKAGGPPMKCL